MRMTEAEFREFAAKQVNWKSQLASNAAANPLVEQVASEEAKTKSQVASTSLSHARITTLCEPGIRFGAGFIGARLLSLNELLRIDMRIMNRYRRLWHQQALVALRAGAGLSPGSLPGPLRVTLFRRGKRLVDNDGLAASFKFAIDGFKEAGLILDDNPTIIETIELRQEKGGYAVAILFENTDTPVNPLLIHQLTQD